MRKAFIILGPLLLAGCLGGKNAPDATLVVDAPPLVIPPHFELRPPQGDVEEVAEHVSLQGYQPENEASQILVGEAVSSEKEETDVKKSDRLVDQWLLKKAGSSSRNPSIRALMAQEAYQKELEKKKEQKKGWFSRKFGDKTSEKEADASASK